MPTPRKRGPSSPHGPSVVDPAPLGRPPHGIAFAAGLAERVKAIRARLSEGPDSASPGHRLTRRTFAARIGLNDTSLATRLRTASPTLFSAQELAIICAEFGVRAEYLLLGQEPMMHADVVAPVSEVTFAETQREHLARVLAARLEQDAEWLDGYLPDAGNLQAAIELGVAEAVEQIFEARVTDRLQAGAAMRDAVAARARAAMQVPDVSSDSFKSVVAGLLNGSVVDLGADEPVKPPSST